MAQPEVSSALDGLGLPRPDPLAQIQTIADDYGPAQFDADMARPLISLAELPAPLIGMDGLPVGFPHLGWGKHLDSRIGGGLAPGNLLGFGAGAAGVGKTTFLSNQLDGLAMRSVEIVRGETKYGNVLTPIILMSEMPTSALYWRSLASILKVPVSYFRAGSTILDNTTQPVEREAICKARKNAELWLQPDALFGASRYWIARRPSVADLKSFVNVWRDALAQKYPHLSVVPVVVLDPIQRFLDPDEHEITALNSLGKRLVDLADSEELVVLLTSDTNKASAGGKNVPKDPQEMGASAYRGSYGLIHNLDYPLYLRHPKDSQRSNPPEVEIAFAKNRWGYVSGGTARQPFPRFDWYGENLRFVPVDEAEASRRVAAEFKKKSSKSKRTVATQKEPAVVPAVSPVALAEAIMAPPTEGDDDAPAAE